MNFRLFFLISSMTSGISIVVYHLVLTVLRSSRAKVAAGPHLPKKTAIIFFDVLREHTPFVEFGSNSRLLSCHLLRYCIRLEKYSDWIFESFCCTISDEPFLSFPKLCGIQRLQIIFTAKLIKGSNLLTNDKSLEVEQWEVTSKLSIMFHTDLKQPTSTIASPKRVR